MSLCFFPSIIIQMSQNVVSFRCTMNVKMLLYQLNEKKKKKLFENALWITTLSVGSPVSILCFAAKIVQHWKKGIFNENHFQMLIIIIFHLAWRNFTFNMMISPSNPTLSAHLNLLLSVCMGWIFAIALSTFTYYSWDFISS